MAVKEIRTEDEFQRAISSHEVATICFYTDGMYDDSRYLSSFKERVVNSPFGAYAGVGFYICDSSTRLAQKKMHDTSDTPTTLIFKNGEVVDVVGDYLNLVVEVLDELTDSS